MPGSSNPPDQPLLPSLCIQVRATVHGHGQRTVRCSSAVVKRVRLMVQNGNDVLVRQNRITLFE
jgi:hypothetical protein